MTDYRIELGDSRERLVGHPIYNLVHQSRKNESIHGGSYLGGVGLSKFIESSAATAVLRDCSVDANLGCRGAAFDK
jgi:hypothetical protein